MRDMTEKELFSGELKKVEQKIISFYNETGKKVGNNAKATEIFAYLKIYESLTQEQLKTLTNFSSSTISTTLQTFLQSSIVTEELLHNSRKHLYKLDKEKVTFVYNQFDQLMSGLEKIDNEVESIQSEVKTYQDKYPYCSEFLILRLNGIRNYIEAQYRVIKHKKKYPYFDENVTKLKNPNNMTLYPPELLELEKKVVRLYVSSETYERSSAIRNYIIPYLVTRREVDQEILVELTGLSRSSISRTLQELCENSFFSKAPREFRKPVKYCLESFDLFIIEKILNSDYFIFSWEDNFKEILNDLQNNSKYNSNSIANKTIQKKVQEILLDMENFREGSNLLEKAHKELKNKLAE